MYKALYWDINVKTKKQKTNKQTKNKLQQCRGVILVIGYYQVE